MDSALMAWLNSLSDRTAQDLGIVDDVMVDTNENSNARRLASLSDEAFAILPDAIW